MPDPLPPYPAKTQSASASRTRALRRAEASASTPQMQTTAIKNAVPADFSGVCMVVNETGENSAEDRAVVLTIT
jgi:hypothetical protein